MIQASWNVILIVFVVSAVVCGLIAAVTLMGNMISRVLRGL